MPLVHFFETSFGRTTERRIVLVEVSERRRFGLGRGHGRRESVLQRRMDRVGVADPARLRCAARAPSRFRERGRRRGASAHIRGHLMARGGLEVAVWDLEARMLGKPLYQHIGGGARREIPCGVSIGIQDSVAAASAEDRNRTRGRLSAHQDEDQARLGCGRGARGARAISRTFC